MEAIGLNPIRLDRIGLDPIRVNAIKLGVPGAASGSARPYIDPEVLASLVAVCICDGKSNNDPDRAVIKNLVDPDNPFIISNAAYKLNSGYGKYEEDFTTWRKYQNVVVTKDKITVTDKFNQDWLIYKYSKSSNGISPMRIKITGIPINARIEYRYAKTSSDTTLSSFDILEDGIYDIPESFIINNEYSVGFKLSAGDWTHIEITQIPSHQGAFVTDGKDDLITSTKTVKEMLGGSNKCTVISLITHISGSGKYNIIGNGGIQVSDYSGQSFMAGCSSKSGEKIVELGDKEKLKALQYTTFDSKISIGLEDSSYAYYGTFVFNKDSVPIDWIHQVISYFNLDKHVKPDIIYDTIRQGITNENHASFNDELVDFSGNGHNMKIYNSAWKLGSGIGKYEADYSTWIKTAEIISTPFGFKITEPTHNYWLLYTSNITVPAHKVEISGIPEGGEFRYLGVHILKNGINELPKMEEHPSAIGFTLHRGTTQPSDWVGLSVEQIPDYEGALVSDGIDDYGKVENLPIYKDYTVVADRAWTNDLVKDQCLTSKLNGDNFGSFSFELIENGFSSYSFGISNKGVITIDSNKKISYQSKYVYNSSPIISGNNVDGKDLFLFRNRDSYPYYAEAAIWSYILFPYSLSEFLLERQLKRYKLGTLYPGMIEWRPKVNINVPVVTPPTFSMNNGSDIITNGQYIPEGTEITIRVFTTTDSSVGGINEATAKINGVDIELSPSGNKTYYGGKFIVSSKQKIDITIDKYIRYEDIVQPYPAIINLKQDGKTITWGDKLKVGSDIVFVGSANLLPELYTVSETRYNGVTLYPNTIIKVEKSMVFDNARTYLKANEPNCILSPNRLRIPNSSYKILRYIPDLTGKGNHGRLNNFAYTEESGANEDGSIRFDGTDDHITISTLAHGGKCMLMKVNWNKDALMLYDQRRDNNPNSFAIYIPNFNNEDSIAYSSRNDGKTYIDGVLNTSVKGSQLKDVTHNITITNSNSNNDNTVSPAIGSNAKYNAFYAQMVLYEFMLFPDVPDEEEIKELNDIVGIENNIEVS